MRSDILPVRLSDGGELAVPVVSVNTLIIGAGAAALKCADTLHALGVRDLAIVVDRLGNGTSNNSGSDKQTYYKVGIFGDDPDSPMEFARTLFQGGMMHGDLAYVEGLGSAPAFFDLCKLGVPFPFNRYGGYVGYKTDHDPRQRATSAGPKTSMFMFRALLDQVRHHQIPIFDRHEAVRLLVRDTTAGRRVTGAVCLDRAAHHTAHYGMVLFNAENVVMGTGGPGEMYRISVWPHGQLGSHGLAFEVGAVGNNLTELQYGLASTRFRWNLSGTYQQVVPDYFSTAADGAGDRRHFLHDYFDDMATMATCIFLKGYQWPFHAARLQKSGSSLVDIAVHNEISAGRRVFMDFLHNPAPAPGMKPFSINEMRDEARRYLERSGALQGTPYERLEHMNRPSIELYAEHGIDLREPLEVAVCAQHCNGGLRGNLWWETSVPHLFAVGELNGTHGVRPGGSALNSGQVGAVRAAQYIAHVYQAPPLDPHAFLDQVAAQVTAQHAEYTAFLHAGAEALELDAIRPAIQERMSRCGGFVRSLAAVRQGLREARELYARIRRHGVRCPDTRTLVRATEDKALALSSLAFLEALLHYIEHGGGSRGGYMILDEAGALTVDSRRGSELRHRPENLDKRREILEVQAVAGRPGEFTVTPVPVRPLPADESWYETTWTAWSEGRIYRE
ncbi:MAG: succinate dehydrogenase flavoprotein subunit [Lentisphaerae bacterium ADurb.BinA184]|nr:MAG: succinate dehydrogenase flavoprotein subunit [Lentisphaerae bacterium ADurb.BinA184]